MYTLCLSDNNVAKCRYKGNKHIHLFQTYFLLSFVKKAGSSLLFHVWLHFKIAFKKVEIVVESRDFTQVFQREVLRGV